MFKRSILAYVIIGLISLLSLMTAYSIYSYGGLDISLRLIVITVVLAISGILAITLYLQANKKRVVAFIITLAISLVYCVGLGFGFSVLSKVKSTLDKISSQEEKVTGVIVTLSSSNISKPEELKGKKVGYLDVKESLSGYVIPKKILEEANVDSSITYAPFDQLPYLLNALYKGTIDAMMIGDNYVSTFEVLPGFEDVSKKTKVIATKTEVKTIQINENKVEDILKKPFSVVFMGIDNSKSGDLSGRADALFLATVNPINYTVTVTSIPRDSYVPIACYNGQSRDKITHSNGGGTECVLKTVGNLFGIEVDYFVKINFKGLEDLVDALGGVYIYVDPNKYPDGLVTQNRKRYNEEGHGFIYMRPGNNRVKGEVALAFARSRKNLERGATERAQNQTLVINSIIQEFLSLKNADKIFGVLDAMANNIQTNFTSNQIISFYKFGTDILQRGSKLNINESIVVDYSLVSGYDRMIYHDDFEQLLYQYVPFKKSVEKIKHQIHTNLGLEKYQIPTKFNYFVYQPWVKDQAVYYEYDEPRETFTVPDLVPDMTGWNIDKAREWANARGLAYSEEAVREGQAGYDPNVEHGYVLGHDQKVNRRVSKIGNIAVRYVYNKVPTPEFRSPESHSISIDKLANASIPGVSITLDGQATDLANKVTYRITNVDKSQSYNLSDLSVGEYRIVYSLEYNGKVYEHSIPLHIIEKVSVTMSVSCQDIEQGQNHACSVSFSDGASREAQLTFSPDVASASAGSVINVTASANVSGQDLSATTTFKIKEKPAEAPQNPPSENQTAPTSEKENA